MWALIPSARAVRWFGIEDARFYSSIKLVSRGRRPSGRSLLGYDDSLDLLLEFPTKTCGMLLGKRFLRERIFGRPDCL